LRFYAQKHKLSLAFKTKIVFLKLIVRSMIPQLQILRPLKHCGLH